MSATHHHEHHEHHKKEKSAEAEVHSSESKDSSKIEELAKSIEETARKMHNGEKVKSSHKGVTKKLTSGGKKN